MDMAMTSFTPSNSNSIRMIGPISIEYPSQIPNGVVGQLTLAEIHRKAALTAVSFLYTNEIQSEDIRERTRMLMLNFDLLKNVQFVELCVQLRPLSRKRYSIELNELPTIIYFSQTGEIARQVRPSPDAYEERLKFFRYHWLKYTMTKPLKVEMSAAWKFRGQAKKIVKSARVLLLINGQRQTTWCQQCLRAMEILRVHKIEFKTYNVLKDEGVFRALREIAKYKINFPHIYINGKMIGGLPALSHMHMKGTVNQVFQQLEEPAALAAQFRPENCVPKKAKSPEKIPVSETNV